MSAETTVVQLHDGSLYDYLRPSLAALTLANITVQLSRLPRFVGATGEVYTVGQHSVLCSELLKADPVLARYGLLHDAHEIVMNDISRPLKNTVREVCRRFNIGLNPLNFVNEKARLAVAAKFNLSREVPALVRLADQHLVALEREQLMFRTAELDERWSTVVGRVEGFPDIEIKPWDETTTRKRFWQLCQVFYPRQTGGGSVP
jgi:hypothetical protein